MTNYEYVMSIMLALFVRVEYTEVKIAGLVCFYFIYNRFLYSKVVTDTKF